MAVFISGIGYCEQYPYLDIGQPIRQIGQNDTEIYLIISVQTNKIYNGNILMQYNPLPMSIRDHPSNFLMVQVLYAGQYININGISECLPYGISNGIYRIEYVNKVVPRASAYIKDVEYFLKNIQTKEIARLNLHNFDLSFISIIKQIECTQELIDKKKSISELSCFLYNQRYLLDESSCFTIISCSNNFYRIHKDVIMNISKFIECQQLHNKSFLSSTSSSYAGSDKCIEIFIYLIYHFTLKGYNEHVIDLCDLQDLVKICEYYNVIDEIYQYVYQLISNIESTPINTIHAEFLVTDYGLNNETEI